MSVSAGFQGIHLEMLYFRLGLKIADQSPARERLLTEQSCRSLTVETQRALNC